MDGTTTTTRKKKFTWSEPQTLQFIQLRMENEPHFTGHRNASAQGFAMLIKEMGLENDLTTIQATKKWENLKKKYRDLLLPKTVSGTEGGSMTAANWPFFEAMHKALGQRDLIKPLNLIATAEDSDEPNEEPSTSAPGPSSPKLSGGSKGPKSRKRRNEVLEYLKEYTEREEKRQREQDQREEERERKKQEQLDTLIDIFRKLVEKQ